ncbi:hypothetical protein [Variovorax sp. DAIF25]|jgi:hypothetical protein|uniref:hypothetical protein n=1 Tax=Variovorax sp. DAIF25 TaxID=3080983 RepID=UPI003D6AEB93
MRDFLYYSLMLLLGFAWYRFGQNLLKKGNRDEKDELTKGFVGPVGFLVTAAIACYLFVSTLRALIRGEVPCLGKACSGQVYALATHAGEYWSNVFYMVWLVLALGYALYVTFKIWFRV